MEGLRRRPPEVENKTLWSGALGLEAITAVKSLFFYNGISDVTLKSYSKMSTISADTGIQAVWFYNNEPVTIF